jgi:hypothetical protein
MTCHETREQLSLLMDEALAAPERAAVDAHLAACAECRRELEQLRATVALLDRLPPARAPAGFVDRVMAEAYRPSWPRRVLDVLFVPVRVKLPLEAVAVLLVGVSALYVYERSPEVGQVARQEAQEPSPAPTPPTAAPLEAKPSTPPAPKAVPDPARPTDTVGEAERAREPRVASEPKRQLAKEGAAREEARQARPAGPELPPSAVPAPPAPAARADDAREALSAKRNAEVEPRFRAPGPAVPPAASEKGAQPAEPSAARDAGAAGARALPPAAAPATPPTAALSREAQGPGVGAASTPGSAPATEGPAGQEPAPSKSRAARLTRAVDASGRLTVSARVPAERALDALLARVGGARVGRLLEGDRGMIIIDLLVPAARYPELIEGLGRIGRWVTEYEVGTLPARVRVEVALTVEP